MPIQNPRSRRPKKVADLPVHKDSSETAPPPPPPRRKRRDSEGKKLINKKRIINKVAAEADPNKPKSTDKVIRNQQQAALRQGIQLARKTIDETRRLSVNTIEELMKMHYDDRKKVLSLISRLESISQMSEKLLSSKRPLTKKDADQFLAELENYQEELVSLNETKIGKRTLLEHMEFIRKQSKKDLLMIKDITRVMDRSSKLLGQPFGGFLREHISRLSLEGTKRDVLSIATSAVAGPFAPIVAAANDILGIDELLQSAGSEMWGKLKEWRREKREDEDQDQIPIVNELKKQTEFLDAGVRLSKDQVKTQQRANKRSQSIASKTYEGIKSILYETLGLHNESKRRKRRRFVSRLMDNLPTLFLMPFKKIFSYFLQSIPGLGMLSKVFTRFVFPKTFQFIARLFSLLTKVLGPTIGKLLPVLMRLAGPIGIIVSAALAIAGVWKYRREIGEFFTETFPNWVKNSWKFVSDWFVSKMSGAFDKIESTFISVGEWAADKLGTAFDFLKARGGEVWEYIRDKASAAWEWVASLPGKILDSIKSLPDLLTSVVGKVGSMMSEIGKELLNPNTWANLFTPVAQWIINLFSNAVKSLAQIDLVKKAGDLLSSFLPTSMSEGSSSPLVSKPSVVPSRDRDTVIRALPEKVVPSLQATRPTGSVVSPSEISSKPQTPVQIQSMIDYDKLSSAIAQALTPIVRSQPTGGSSFGVRTETSPRKLETIPILVQDTGLILVNSGAL